MRRLLVALGLATACNGGEAPEPNHPQKAKSYQPVDASRVHAFESVRLGTVPAGTFGPYVAETAAGGIAAWAAQDGNSRSWFAVTFANGKANVPVRLGPAPAEVGLAMIEAASSDGSSGFVLLDTRKDGERTVVEAQRIGPRGEAARAPSTLAVTSTDVVWIDLIATGRDVLALWAVRQSDGAELFAAPVPSEPTSSRVEAQSLAKEARAWQAAPHGDAAAVGIVLPGGKSDKGGRVEVALLGPTGAVKERVDVLAKGSAEPDLDMVASGRGLLLAWSDKGELESRVALAAIDGAGKLSRAPAPAVQGLGEQALVRLVGGHGKAFLAWENLQERPVNGRTILVATVGSDGSVSAARAELHHAATDSLPELSATPRGLGALVLAPACRRGQDCSGVALVPTFVELDPSLGVSSSEPVRLSSLGGEPPDLAWGLSCAYESCFVLGAQATNPAPVFAVHLGERWNEFEPAATPVGESKPPRVASLDVIAAVAPLAGVASARIGSSTVASWVTYFDPSTPYQKPTQPAADGKLEPLRALLQARALPEGGSMLPAETISLRARSLGGVTLAPIGTGATEALLGWTALDAKVPQVFVTVVDDKGKKLRQRMLTRAPGEKSDVAAVGSGDGWLVAWVDERGGDPELYATRLVRHLQSTGPERRITNAKGAASDVVMLARGADALVAWADGRDAPKPGWGDIWVTKLAGADGSALGPEQVVAKTPLLSRAPVLGALGKSAVLAWIEESPADSGGSGEGELRLVELDDAGHALKSSTSVKLANGTPSSIALDCDAERCHVVTSVNLGEHEELQAFEWSPSGGATAPVRLIGLTGPAGATPALALSGRELFVADRRGSEGRVRLIVIDWR
jgi:hypothetical protein